MNTLKKLAVVIRNAMLAYKLVVDHLETEEENARRLSALKSYNVIGDHEIDNPAVYIGAALRLAKKHNLVIESGLSFGSVRVYLPPELFPEGVRYNSVFRYPPPDDAPNSAWVDRRTLQAAVCDCLIACLNHGLVNPLPASPYNGKRYQ